MLSLEYAKSVGFGTAKLSSRRSRASKEFIDAKFSCIRYGNKQQSDDAINPRPSPKIGCKAILHVKRKSNGKWYVYKFIKEHNHELLPEQAHFFRSHRNSDSLNNDVRARKRKILASLSKQFSSYQNVGCSDNFTRSQHDKGQSLSLEYGDAQLLLDLFMQMQEDDPRFFYAVDLNEEQRLRNVLWVDTKALTDYTYFGDVVSIDTTYFSNKYKSPLLFVGVNHHIQPTLLGCALIANDTVHTFLWVLQTWLIAMGGRPPQVVLTDESKALTTAVREIMPESRHFFCLWHILEKIPKRLEAISVWLEDFMKKFSKCIYRSWTEVIFEKRWWKLLEKFKLQENEWLRSIYETRMHWVPVFTQGVSFVALSTASRCDSVNSYFDKFVNPETSVREFIEQYKVLLGNRFEEEAKAEFEAWHEAPELKSPSPFEKQMAWVYTHEIFKKFQVEVLGAAACHLKKENEDINIVTYTIKDFEKNQEFIVEWNESNSDISCLCHLFEYQGYLCRHAIVVLQMSVIHGAGGMHMVDPLFQRMLVKLCRSKKIPVIFDEVFTGFWRLGVESAAELLHCTPDIACYAKLMTGGIIPLAATVATEDVFKTFVDDSKLKALLHGHSYSAHAMGCSAAVTAIQSFKDPKKNPNILSEGEVLRELWDAELVHKISLHPQIKRLVMLGTVFALELQAEGSNAGYASTYAMSLVQELREDGVYMRPLGNVLYLMCGPCTPPRLCSQLLLKLYQKIDEFHKSSSRAQVNEC